MRIVLKCDAQGSLEALTARSAKSRARRSTWRLIHAGVGPISESDILLASASNAVVVGFNVKVESNGRRTPRNAKACRSNFTSIIYELIDQMKEAMAGLLDPEHRETVIGHAEVKQVFQVEPRDRRRLPGH